MDEPPDLAQLRRKLERYLDELFGGFERDGEGDYALAGGSSTVWVRPFAFGGRTGVRVWSVLAADVRADDELTRFIATENGRLAFGVLYLAENRPVVALAHTLLGAFLNRKELEVAVAAIGAAADHYDDVLRARFGGRLFTEAG